MAPRVFIAPMFAAVCFILAYIVVKGRGDKFIAGYNTASKEEKAQVNVKRQRILLALLSVLSGTIFCIIPLLADNNGAITGAMVVLLSFGLAFIVLANTWAKKK